MADAVGLELLGKRSLLLYVLASAVAERLVDIRRPARMDQIDRRRI